jgi:threonine dehydratase
VIAVSAANARVMYESLNAGRPLALPEEPTLANALSGGIGLENHHTLRLVRELVDRHVLADEDEIGRAMAFAATVHKLVVEGGGAVGIAALLAGRIGDLGGPLAVVVSGGNVAPGVIARLAARYV